MASGDPGNFEQAHHGGHVRWQDAAICVRSNAFLPQITGPEFSNQFEIVLRASVILLAVTTDTDLRALQNFLSIHFSVFLLLPAPL